MAGRVTRGAVAANTNVDSDSNVAPARAYDSDVYGDRSQGAMPGSTGYGSRGYEDERLRHSLPRGCGCKQLRRLRFTCA